MFATYHCRDCGKSTPEDRTEIEREQGASVKCPVCGGICDPSEQTLLAEGERQKGIRANFGTPPRKSGH
ncbi:MAG: hypothetical protein M3552_16790 [Planctomycetota bacterium]|nr:hypothetical protein [Planctomycetota bacterium]